MILTGAASAVFVLVLLAVYYLLPKGAARNSLLAFTSFGTYAVLDPAGAVFMAPLAILCFAAVNADPVEGKGLRRFAIIAALAVLIGFKYLLPLQSTQARPFSPLGVSYLCFQAVLCVSEAGKGRIGKTGVSTFFSYFFLFSTTASGPIKSLARFADSEAALERQDALADIVAGVRRIIFGLAKKIVIASSLFPLTAGLTKAGATTFDLWIGLYAYAFYIYFDFSGYTDMAVGMARLFGYRIEENFDLPYLKTNIRDFWRAWHMSLTAFMRDIVYIPLGGNRCSPLRRYRNIMVVFLLIGLWHGKESHFLLWGAWHGLGSVGYQAWKKFSSRKGPDVSAKPSRFIYALSVVATFHFVAFGWILFACDTHRAWDVFLGLAGLIR